jgi:hypothetical protein
VLKALELRDPKEHRVLGFRAHKVLKDLKEFKVSKA